MKKRGCFDCWWMIFFKKWNRQLDADFFEKEGRKGKWPD
jgi:hypothetical protein